jgi:hypothetical protein
MKILLLLIYLLLNQNIFSSTSLNDVKYLFDKDKLSNANDSFHFLRTYVDYYYLLIKNNPALLADFNDLSKIEGLCVGDAHPENFGTIIKNDGSIIFTHNDVDDSAPCPVIFDFMRLVVSSKLYNDSIITKDIFAHYLNGLNNGKESIPNPIIDMLTKAQKKGTEPSNKKVVNEKIIRDEISKEIPLSEIQAIKKLMAQYIPAKWNLIDQISTMNLGGGSGKLKRYELLYKSGDHLLHLELKTQSAPSVYPVANNIPDQKSRLFSALKMDQGEPISAYYNVITINDIPYLVRPRFAGNIGVSLDKFNLNENESIILYEAYQLGMIHQKSIKAVKNYISMLTKLGHQPISDFSKVMADFYNLKFNELKKP